jgi:phosphoribosylpyrophosphate synthetase
LGPILPFATSIEKRPTRLNRCALIGEVEGKDVVLVDDLVDTAGTICKAASLLKEKGANTVRAICTHAVLSGNAYEKHSELRIGRVGSIGYDST